MNVNKRRGFTLIELVIVVAIIGILALMVLPQFNNVTKDAKIRTFESNCQTAVSAYAMYQAGHNGDKPTASSDLDDYLNGSFADMADKPTGASYGIDATGTFSASYKDDANSDHNFTYPD